MMTLRAIPNTLVALMACAPWAAAQPAEVFEKKVRPVFAEHCIACHNQKLRSGGLDLATQDGLSKASAAGFFLLLVVTFSLDFVVSSTTFDEPETLISASPMPASM